MPICPDCLSRDTVRWGSYNNLQKWHCNSCGLTTVHPRLRMPIQKPRKTKK
jgi:Zn ribbon nucleic-acid-binding protein